MEFDFRSSVDNLVMDATQPTIDNAPFSRDSTGIGPVARVLAAVSDADANAVLRRLPDEVAVAIRNQMSQTAAPPPTKPSQPNRVDRFAFLQSVPQSKLFVAIMRERPQTIAIILSVIPAQFAPCVIRALSPHRQIEVLDRLSRLPDRPSESVSKEVVDALLSGVKERIEKVCIDDRSFADGVQRVASILKACDRDTESSILALLGQHDQQLTGKIQQMLFTFNDLAMLSDAEIQSLTKHVHVQTWAMALKRAEPDVRSRLFETFSPRAAQHVRAEMNYLGQATPSEIDQAQNQIVNAARKLQSQSAPIRRAA